MNPYDLDVNTSPCMMSIVNMGHEIDNNVQIMINDEMKVPLLGLSDLVWPPKWPDKVRYGQ